MLEAKSPEVLARKIEESEHGNPTVHRAHKARTGSPEYVPKFNHNKLAIERAASSMADMGIMLVLLGAVKQFLQRFGFFKQKGLGRV